MFNTLPELLAALAGFLLSVVAEYVPAYQRLEDKYKRLIMLAALILVAAAVYAVNCTPFLAFLLVILAPGAAFTCDQAGIALLIQAFLAALVANQSAFGLFFRGKGKTAQPAVSLERP